MATSLTTTGPLTIGIAAPQSSWTVRPGTAADSHDLFRVFSQTAFDLRVRLGQANPQEAPDAATVEEQWRQVRPLYEHLAHTAEHVWVAERGRQMIGFARSILRDGVRSLTELWVLPHEQSSGVGRELLRRAFPADGARLRYILATVDTRAQARYMKAGLYSRFSLYVFQRTPEVRRVDTDLVLGHMRATDSDARIVDSLDQRVLGYRRRPEHNWFLQHRRGFLYYRAGEPVGYGYAGEQCGPFVVLEKGDLPTVLAHAESAVARQAHSEIAFVVPTVNEVAIEHLLAHGYCIKPFFCQFMSSQPFGHFDHYVATNPMFVL